MSSDSVRIPEEFVLAAKLVFDGVPERVSCRGEGCKYEADLVRGNFFVPGESETLALLEKEPSTTLRGMDLLDAVFCGKCANKQDWRRRAPLSKALGNLVTAHLWIVREAARTANAKPQSRGKQGRHAPEPTVEGTSTLQ